MLPFPRKRTRRSRAQVRIKLLDKNFRKFARAQLNPSNFISRLRNYLESHEELINQENKLFVGDYLQDQCVKASKTWEVVFETEEYPLNYSPLKALPSSFHDGSSESKKKEAEPTEVADANLDEVLDANAGISSPNAEPNSTDAVIHKQRYINQLCRTLEKLTTTANRDNTNKEEKWLRFRVSILRETANLFGIPNTDFRCWFY